MRYLTLSKGSEISIRMLSLLLGSTDYLSQSKIRVVLKLPATSIDRETGVLTL